MARLILHISSVFCVGQQSTFIVYTFIVYSLYVYSLYVYSLYVYSRACEVELDKLFSVLYEST